MIGELKRSLLGALTRELPSGAPAALAACTAQAPAITAGLARDGVTVGRATRKPRNAANAARGWQLDAIAQFEAARSNGSLATATFAQRLPDGRIGYAEPLVIQEVCLACHGAAIDPAVRAAIATTYPADQAVGYAVGDLRGVAWVELPP